MDDKTLLDQFGSLSREIGGVKDSLASLSGEMREGFDCIEPRLGRQGGIINGGSRQVARLIEWSEKVDTIIADRDVVIADLRRRLEKLETRQ
jgi:hypothetical protein